MKKFAALFLAILNLAASALYIWKMPDGSYPVHYGINNQPDRYGGKWNLIVPAVIGVVLVVLFMIYRRCTKNNENVQKNKKYENIVIPIVYVLIALISWIMILGADGVLTMTTLLPTAIMIILGAMFVVLSNYMGKVKQNRYFGIKMHATLNNVTVWRKTHRLAGILGTIGGVMVIAAGVASAFFKNEAIMMIIVLVAILAAIFLFGVIPSIYAAKLYSKLGDDNESVGWYGSQKKGE